MKTLEFKLSPTIAQAQSIDQWLEELKWVWNRGLSLLEEAQQRRWRERHAAPLPESIKLKWKDEKFTGCGVRKTREGYKYCEIRTNRNIEDPKKLFYSGSYYNNSNAPDFVKQISSKYRTGVHKSLLKAWQNYQDPQQQARRPQYKRKHDKLKSLANYNAGGKSKELKPVAIKNGQNAHVSFPGLGKIRVKGLFDRFNQNLDYGRAIILKEPSGYYLQVAVDMADEQLKESDRPVGIDPGLISIITTDQAREVKPPKLYRNQQKKLRRLQRKASRQVKGSGSQKRTYKLIAKLHEKIRRSRNAFNHKLSTKIVREYGGIAVEDIPVKNLSRKPKAKQREDGKGYEQNGAKRKAGLNKSFADSALGDLISKIETKAAARGREFVRVPAAYTTINCSQCGEQIKKALSMRTHRCTACGFVAGRDENAAINILAKGRELFGRIYRAWSREVKRDEQASSNGGMPPEDNLLSTDTEYVSRSPCGDEGLFPLFALQNPLNSAKQPPKKKTCHRMKNNDESFIQLTLWDFGTENDSGG